MNADINDILDNKNEPTEQELTDFKVFVNDWIKYDEQIKKLIIATKERKRYQKTLNNKIQDFMQQYKYNDLNTTQGKIKSNIKEINAPIKISDIKEKIVKYNNLSGEELIKKIFEEERSVVVKKSLKRVVPKVSLSLNI